MSWLLPRKVRQKEKGRHDKAAKFIFLENFLWDLIEETEEKGKPLKVNSENLKCNDILNTFINIISI